MKGNGERFLNDVRSTLENNESLEVCFGENGTYMFCVVKPLNVTMKDGRRLVIEGENFWTLDTSLDDIEYDADEEEYRINGLYIRPFI